MAAQEQTMVENRRRIAVATGLLAVYGFILSRAVGRMVLSDVNGSAKAFFLTVYLGTLVLVAVSCAMSWQNRKQAVWVVPIAGSAIVGSAVCLLFYGAWSRGAPRFRDTTATQDTGNRRDLTGSRVNQKPGLTWANTP